MNYAGFILLLFGLMICSASGRNNIGKDSRIDNDVSVLLLPENDTVYIDQKTINQIKPKIKDWLDFYELDISSFYFDGESVIDLSAHEEGSSVFFSKLTNKDVECDPRMCESSPNGRYHIPMYDVYYDEDSEKYYAGWDDSQSVWLQDMNAMSAYVILFNGVAAISEAAYWIDDDVLVLVSREDYTEDFKYVIHFYDLGQMVSKIYSLKVERPDEEKLFYRYVLSQRGIDVEN